MAHGFEKGLDVADVYAAALYALADEAGRVDEVRAELDALNELVAAQPELLALLESAVIDAEARGESLERMFRGRLSDTVVNTVQVMNQHGRAGLLHALRSRFIQRTEDARGQVEATATSAVPLDSDQQAEIVRLAEQLSGKRPLLKFEVDPEVLGGLILTVGDYRYDHSIRRHLHVARQQLLERTVRGASSDAAG